MASVLPPRCPRIAQLARLTRRNFTQSAPASKKRTAASSNRTALDDDELFTAPSAEDDLFPSSIPAQPISSSFNKPHAYKKKNTTTQVTKSPLEHFDEQYAFITARLGPKPVERHPQVQYGAIRQLLHYAQGREQLERIVQVLARWRADGKVVDFKTTREIIDRCLAWSPPTLLTILTDKQKYGLTLPNMAVARRILHRLILFRPHPISQQSSSPSTTTPAEEENTKGKANAEALKNAATFAALLPNHGFKRATEDVVCCALLAQACARNLNSARTMVSIEKSVNEEATPTMMSPINRIQYSAESTRGLFSISSALVSLLSQPDLPTKLRNLPSPGYVKALAEKYKAAAAAAAAEEEETEMVIKYDPVVFQKRMSGVTYTGLVERSWVVTAIRDVVRALKGLENASGAKPVLTKLEKVLENTLRREDAESVIPSQSGA